MRVQDLMVVNVTTVTPEMTCAAAAEVMRDEGLGLLIVAERGKLAGVLTDRGITVDCVAPGFDPKTTSVSAIMVAGIYTARPDQPIEAATRAMREFGFRRLPVIEDDGTLLGLISMAGDAP